jgi:hypothetical protein
MIKYIKKIIKKHELLKKYKDQIDDCLFLLTKTSIVRNSKFYLAIEKDMMYLCTCYNRIKKL